jgi:DNA-binding helix-hairpin-helix protein with protein kinase domain
MPLSVKTDAGHTLELVRRVGNGGEGVVYEVRGAPLLVKLLLRPAGPEQAQRRLEALVRHGRRPPVVARLLSGQPRRAAWPLHTVRVIPARDHAVSGFLMWDLRQWYRPLDSLLSPAQRRVDFPAATWATGAAAAGQLARLVAELHEAGYVIGDLKPANLWIDAAANVGVSDVDSFQFSDGGQVFAGRARSEGYTAPECIDNTQSNPEARSDDFVLAVLIYQLLMGGMHPFHGIPGDGSRYISLDDNILRGRCRVVDPASVRPLPGDPPVSALPRRVRGLLRQCFGEAARLGGAPRATAREWVAVLSEAQAPGRLRACTREPGHIYSAERPWCPWCDAASGTRTANRI